MPRKFKTPAVTAQNRENQRQSRARRKELIANLKRRLDEYERRGAAASLEMQAAARAVNAENRHLRALLEMHGVSRDQVDRYLALQVCPAREGSNGDTEAKRRDWQPEQAGEVLALPDGQHQQQEAFICSKPSVHQALPPPPLPSSSISCSNRTAVAQQRFHTETSPDSNPMAQTLSPRTGINEEKTILSEGEGRQREADERCQWPQVGGHDADAADALDGDTTCPSICMLPPVSDCFCPPESSAPPLRRAETLETSCDVAAAILVTMHRQADPARARAALGCRGPSVCSVQNVKIFQLMDKLG